MRRPWWHEVVYSEQIDCAEECEMMCVVNTLSKMLRWLVWYELDRVNGCRWIWTEINDCDRLIMKTKIAKWGCHVAPLAGWHVASIQDDEVLTWTNEAETCGNSRLVNACHGDDKWWGGIKLAPNKALTWTNEMETSGNSRLVDYAKVFTTC